MAQIEAFSAGQSPLVAADRGFLFDSRGTEHSFDNLSFLVSQGLDLLNHSWSILNYLLQGFNGIYGILSLIGGY